MSSFGAKRKARKIPVLDDDGDSPAQEPENPTTELPSEAVQPSLKFGKRAHKQSSLRKSINVNDDDNESLESGVSAIGLGQGDDDAGPVVIKPSLSRAGSTKLKKRASSSRLSFGTNETSLLGEGSGDVFTPKKSTLGQKALENSAFKRSISQRLPTRNLGDDEDRPKYSKEYLDELQSSTPNTPSNPSALRNGDDDMELDPSEIEGALVVESTDLAAASLPTTAHIMTEAEIREKKERRARLAREQDFISLDDSENERNGNYISLLPRKQKTETRLVREDEDLGEGFEEFVEDGGLSLGRKAEREARRRKKQEMADLINAAADADDDGESDDSETERRAAYEAAQTRAGMDGLQRATDRDDLADPRTSVPKMKPLPDFTECLAKMEDLVKQLDVEVKLKRKKLADLAQEKAEIAVREKEVQDYLDKAGQKYQSLAGAADGGKLAAQSPLRPVPFGMAAEFPFERGLESLGTTPTRRHEPEE